MMPSKKRMRCALAATVLAGVSFATTLSAQVDPDSVKLRNDCRLATQVLRAGVPAPHRADALTIMPFCRGDAIAGLSVAWMTPNLSDLEIGTLVTASRSLIDPVLIDTLFGVLQHGSGRLEMRLASLRVLATYADPHLAPTREDVQLDSASAASRRLGIIDHPMVGVGRESIPPTFNVRLRTVLKEIEASDADFQMRTAAGLIERTLARRAKYGSQ